MFRRVFFTSLAVVSLALTAPFAAQAQSIFISGGLASPSGDDMDGVDTGWMVAGGLIFDVGSSGVWAGVDGAYGRNTTDLDGETVKPFSVMGVLGYSFPTEGSVSPYVWGGAGLQGIKFSDELGGSESESGFGWQAGAGISFGGADSNVRPYVEGRYHSASIDIDGFDVDVRFFGALFGVSIGIGD